MTDLGRLALQGAPIDVLVCRAQEQERRRIARDLHDSTSQYLVGLQFSIARLKQAPLSDPLQAIVADCEVAVAAIQREIRTLSYLCHPPLLGSHDLGVALETMTRGVGNRAGLAVVIGVENVGKIGPMTEAAFYRLAQEALANVCRHAKASQIVVHLAGKRDYVHLMIEDDGIGLGADAAYSSAGVGLASMRERMAQVGGRLSIRRLSKGTRLLASLPRQPRRSPERALGRPGPVEQSRPALSQLSHERNEFAAAASVDYIETA